MSGLREHPKGLFILFFAEMWERFSYYGMRSLLVLYVATEFFAHLSDEDSKDMAYGIFAAYGALVYATPLLGGFLADKFIGYRKAILLGGALMAAGHLLMAFPFEVPFYGALGLLIIGNGFFKPNISSLVGSLYKENDPRRDAGFTIFYMGINLGAFLSPLACGYIGMHPDFGWHYGFGLAGIGMLAGLVVFWRGITKNIFHAQGLQPEKYRTEIPKELQENEAESGQLNKLGINNKIFGFNIFWWITIGAVLIVPILSFIVKINDVQINFLGGNFELMSLILLAVLAGVIVILIIRSFSLSKIEIHRLVVLVMLSACLTVFWSFFEQAGSSLVMFAKENVNLIIINSAQTNSINPFYIIVLAIPFSLLWGMLSQKKINPRTPIKFSLGIAQLGIGFLIFAFSANFFDDAGKVPFIFLIIGWLVITTGELFLSPIGLSKVTELAPKNMVGFMMGVFFLSSTFAHYISGAIAKLTTKSQDDIFAEDFIEKVTGLTKQSSVAVSESVSSLFAYTSVFAQIALVSGIVAIIVLILTPWLNKWMHGVK